MFVLVCLGALLLFFCYEIFLSTSLWRHFSNIITVECFSTSGELMMKFLWKGFILFGGNNMFILSHIIFYSHVNNMYFFWYFVMFSLEALSIFFYGQIIKKSSWCNSINKYTSLYSFSLRFSTAVFYKMSCKFTDLTLRVLQNHTCYKIWPSNTHNKLFSKSKL